MHFAKHVVNVFIVLVFLAGFTGLLVSSQSSAHGPERETLIGSPLADGKATLNPVGQESQSLPLKVSNRQSACGAGTEDQRFVVKSGEVCDNKTGLSWQQTPGSPSTVNCGNTHACTWQQAMDYCTNLTLNGKQWRLPEVKELISLVDYSVPIQSTVLNTPNGPFVKVRPANYWSATPNLEDPDAALFVSLYSFGDVGSIAKAKNILLAWCLHDVHHESE